MIKIRIEDEKLWQEYYIREEFVNASEQNKEDYNAILYKAIWLSCARDHGPIKDVVE